MRPTHLSQFLARAMAARLPILITGAPGVGKCLGKGTPVLMHDGTVRRVESVNVGDQLMGPDSKPRNVLALSSGQDAMFLVTPTKGDPYVVNSLHVLSLRRSPRTRMPSRKVVNISIRDYLTASRTMRRHLKGWRTGVEFTVRNIAIDPYILGLWLGDGDRRRFAFTNIDPEVIDAIVAYGSAVGLPAKFYAHKKREGIRHVALTGKQGGWQRGRGKNVIMKALDAYGLTAQKFIPNDYLVNSRAIRLAVLAGIVDTDGTLGNNCYDVIQKSARLAEDVVFLARSLGLAAYVRSCVKSAGDGHSDTYWRVIISGNINIIPVRVERKKAAARQQKKDALVTGISVTPIGRGTFYGFSLDSDGLFLLGDFTVTHNSDLVAQAARDADADLILSHPAVADPTDAKGLPWVAKDGESATFLPFGELAQAIRATKPTVWFLDDLGQAPPSVQCFPATTPVLTPTGAPNISELESGDEIIDANGDRQTVLNTYQRTASGLVEITAVGVLPIRATEEHPFCLSSGRTRRYAKRESGYVVVAERFGDAQWKKAQDIRSGDWIAVPIPQASRDDCEFTIDRKGQISRNILLTPEFAKLCGYYVGDGWFVRHPAVGRVAFSLDDKYPEIQQDLASLIQRVLSTKIFSRKQKGATQLGFHDAALGRWMAREMGDRSHTKRIPEWILFHRDLAVLTAFLQGYLNTDGAALRSWGKRRGVQWGTVSRTLALQLQIALTRFSTLAPIKVHCKQGQRVTFPGRDVSYATRDAYIIQCSDRRVLDALKEPYDAKRHVCWSYQHDGKIWTRVKSVKPIAYVGQVFNLEVTGSQSYTAWNVAVHNCSFMQLLLARRVNGHALPECVTFVAATNRRADRAGVSGILEPVKSRFAAIVELEPNLDDWCQWAFTAGVPAELIAFLRFRPDLLCKFTPSADLTNCPLPRTWSHVAQLLALGLPSSIQHIAIAGAVGEGAAVEFGAFLRLYTELPNIDGALMDPDGFTLPTQPATLYAVATALGMRVNVQNFGRIARIAERLTEAQHGEFAALLLRDCVRKDKAVMQTAAFVQLASGDLGQLIAGGAQ